MPHLVPSIAKARPRKKLNPAQVRTLKSVAQDIDKHEGPAIKARGREVFQRHARIREIIDTLKARRLEKGLTLADIAARSGIAKPNLSRLENNRRTAPTLDTLHRYAQALGMTVRVELISKN